MDKPNISQSLIKKIWEYLDGRACGMAVKEVDILKNYEFIPSGAMKLGQYFEYLAIGNVLRDGSIPEAPVTLKGELNADGKRALAQSINFKEAMSFHNFEILSSGETFMYEENGYNLKIVTDATVKTIDHELAILDLKFTGLLGDRWHEMGWDIDKFQYREKLNIQPLFYKYVMDKGFGYKDIPFYYAIHSSKNDFDYELWCVNIPNYEKVMKQLEDEISHIISVIETDKFQPIPDVKRCSVCPLKQDCLFKMEYPDIRTASVYSLKDEIRKV